MCWDQAPQFHKDTFCFLSFLQFLLIFTPLYFFQSLPLSPPAVRDNYFQTSGPMGEAVLSKAAFIKKSRSCEVVFALRWQKRKQDGKSKTQKKRKWKKTHLSWDMFLSWMRRQHIQSGWNKEEEEYLIRCRGSAYGIHVPNGSHQYFDALLMSFISPNRSKCPCVLAPITLKHTHAHARMQLACSAGRFMTNPGWQDKM